MLTFRANRIFPDPWPTGRRQARLDRRGHHRKLVAPQLRAAAVSVYSAAHHQAEGAQTHVPGPAAREGYASS